MTTFKVGDTVVVKNPGKAEMYPDGKPIPATIVKKHGNEYWGLHFADGDVGDYSTDELDLVASGGQDANS